MRASLQERSDDTGISGELTDPVQVGVFVAIRIVHFLLQLQEFAESHGQPLRLPPGTDPPNVVGVAADLITATAVGSAKDMRAAIERARAHGLAGDFATLVAEALEAAGKPPRSRPVTTKDGQSKPAKRRGQRSRRLRRDNSG